MGHRKALAAHGRRIPRTTSSRSSETNFPAASSIFSSQFTNTITPTGPTSATQGGGYTGADFMLGDMNNAIIAVALAQADFRNKRMGELYRRHLASEPAPDPQPGLPLGSGAAFT